MLSQSCLMLAHLMQNFSHSKSLLEAKAAVADVTYMKTTAPEVK